MADASSSPGLGVRGGDPWAQPVLTGASLADLFTLYGRILDELSSREVIRSRNQPLGDYSEWLVCRALRGLLADNKSEKAFDVVADLGATLLDGRGPHDGAHQGAQIQVKARAISAQPKRDQLQTSPFHAGGFDYLALVLHRAFDFHVEQAVLMPVSAVHLYARTATARRDDVLRLWMTQQAMTDPSTIEITGLLRSAAETEIDLIS
ncbi:hypothetical protein [Intrasporangium flavum]|uniref:hypothetical protein n=1 Tax=Intrasporangium flavum TaxID=1428657 RepID=UPI001A965276|nr:hypothetical protein [Intrasporangium flavum]